jgi:hypothetical protein
MLEEILLRRVRFRRGIGSYTHALLRRLSHGNPRIGLTAPYWIGSNPVLALGMAGLAVEHTLPLAIKSCRYYSGVSNDLERVHMRTRRVLECYGESGRCPQAGNESAHVFELTEPNLAY